MLTPRSTSSLLGDTVDAVLDGSLPSDSNRLRVAENTDGKLLGWSFVAADARADRVWELWYIGVHVDGGKGVGDTLLRDAEDVVRFAGGRLLTISVSSSSANLHTRDAYESADYVNCGIVPNYYGKGDDKYIFSKSFEQVHSRSATC